MDAYLNTQFEALGDATRRAILVRLRAGPLAVGELARDFPVSRPAISQHLRILKDASLVIDRVAGSRRIYEINPAALAGLREYFEQFWTEALAAFKRRVENAEASPTDRDGPA